MTIHRQDVGIPSSVRNQLLANLTPRIGVHPPYFTLGDLDLAGLRLSARAVAEAPAYLEVGPMTAAELGRHAAISGLCGAALTQRDERRRYYLAREAHCRYHASDAPFGSPVRFVSTLVELDKRRLKATVTASVEAQPLAEFDLDYTILTEATFERLFKRRATPTPSGPTPYRRLLVEDYQGGGDWAEQTVERVPVAACAGHFGGYPALPVAVIMGQLSYLAGRLADAPFRVSRGHVRASDLGWAGERVTFRAQRLERTGASHRYLCNAEASGREIGHMDLWLELEDEPAV